ncbi:MAG: hypothetical protein E7774_16950 [Bradyrhizobium sp.]|nr:MAG: hypothetical protein E7774_16950 [Bradyrhizobium sp.]
MVRSASLPFAFFLAVAATTAMADDAAKTDQSPPPVASDVPVNPAIHVSPGDSWTYDVRDDITGDARGVVTFEVTKASDTEIETRSTQRKKVTDLQSASTQVFDARWRQKSNGKFAFQPYLASTGVPDDLEVGTTWAFKYEVVRKGSELPKEFRGNGKVESWEKVTLPNGTVYDAFKIDVAAAPASSAGDRKLELHTVMWFAPSVNRLVKRIDENRVGGKLLEAREQTLREYRPAPKT